MNCFFRDDHLSDLIGFEYSNWNGKDAALHFVAQLDAIAQQSTEGETPLVSVILDGENAWEYYPYNGYHFLNDLYTTLESHAEIRTMTYSAYLDSRDAQAGAGIRQGRNVAGSGCGQLGVWDFLYLDRFSGQEPCLGFVVHGETEL